MSKSKVEFIKYLHTQIELQKMRRNPEASKLEGRLFELLDSEFDHSDKLQNIEDNIERIAISLKVSSKAAENAAKDFYGALTDEFKEIREVLIESYCKWDSAISRGDNPDLKLASKHLIMQVEAVFKHFEESVVEFIESSQENIEKYNYIKVSNGKGGFETLRDDNGRPKTRINSNRNGKYMRPRSMSWALRGFLESLGYKIYMPDQALRVLFDVRDYESHAITGKNKPKFDKALGKLSDHASDYFDACLKMIKRLLLIMVEINKE